MLGRNGTDLVAALGWAWPYRRLADLDQVTIGAADVGADWALVNLRLGQEVGALCRPLRVRRSDVATLMLRKALVRSGAAGSESVTVGMSSAGRRPR